jgi:hypothetical protein
MQEVIARPSKYGSYKVADTDLHYVKGTVIEIVTAATFTSLGEKGFDSTGAAQAQVDTVTLTGATGTANITAGGLTKLATFNSTLTQTATDFVTDHAAAYLVVGITVTSSGADVIFTATVTGVAFTSPITVNVTTDLVGTTVNTTLNISSPLGVHGISGAQTVGAKIIALSNFISLELSVGEIVIY